MAMLEELLVRVGIEDGTEEGSSRVQRNLGRMAAGASIAGAAVGVALSEGISTALDIGAARTQLANQLNLSASEAERAGNIAGDVFSAGYGSGLDEVSEAMRGVISNVGDMADTSDAELTSMSQTALALAKNFEFDLGEASQAAGSLMKSGMAADGEEAFDLLTAAASRLPTEMAGEIPKMTTEYTEFFDQLGVTGPQMMGALAEAATNPLFEIDKLGDAVKEFTLRVADTEAVTQPLEDLGLDVADIQALVNKGQGTRAFDQVVTALAGVENQTDRTRIAAELMGGPGEDAQASLIALGEAGGFAQLGLDDVAGSAQTVKDRMEASPAMQWESALRTLKVTLGELLLPVLGEFGAFIEQHKGLLKAALIPALIALAAIFVVLTAATIAWTIALLANPAVWITLAIVALIAVIVAFVVAIWKLIKNWDAVTAKLGRLWDWLKAKAVAIWGGIRAFVSRAMSVISSAVGAGIAFVRGVFLRFHPLGIVISNWGGITGWISRMWNRVIGFLGRIPGRVGGALSGMWSGVTSGLRGSLNGAIGLINSAIGGINSLISGANRIPGVSIPNVPFIPYLADGGIATGPTLAMVGEGREDEAILPLSRLEQMLDTAQAPSAGKVQPAVVRTELVISGDADEGFKAWFRELLRADNLITNAA